MKLSDFSVLDTEFGNMRERFDNEMKKMEEEMNNFRSEMLDRESQFFSKPITGNTSKSNKSSFSQQRESHSQRFVDGKKVYDSSSNKSSVSSSTNQGSLSTTGGAADASSSMLMPGGGLGSHSNWLQGLDSPLIQEDAANMGQKELKLRFDVSQYTPEEIMVKTVDNKLLVHAKHEENTHGNSVFREYNREFLLPSGTDPESIKSSLSKDGILTVEAPLPQPAITQEKH